MPKTLTLTLTYREVEIVALLAEHASEFEPHIGNPERSVFLKTIGALGMKDANLAEANLTVVFETTTGEKNEEYYITAEARDECIEACKADPDVTIVEEG